MKQVELLAPAGNMECAIAAINAGADAIYLGSNDKKINMRDMARNFSHEQLKEITNHAHKNNIKVYLTINSTIYDDELEQAEKLIRFAKEINIDAVILADMSILQLCKKYDMEAHISTQVSISNFESLKFYHSLGAKRFVLARELSLIQIKNIIKKIKENNLDAEIETFIHGAMCVSVSGRCFLSQFSFNKSANKGKCVQPCRREYKISDEDGKEYKLTNNYILSPKDLCTIKFIDKLIDAGIKSLKIEGRARTPEYVKTVVENYKSAINLYKSNQLTKEKKDKLYNNLLKVFHRGFSSGFYKNQPLNEWTDNYGSLSEEYKAFLGNITNFYNKINVAEFTIETNKLSVGDEVYIIGETTGCIREKITSIQTDDNSVKHAKKGDLIGIKLSQKARERDKIYLIKKRDLA